MFRGSIASRRVGARVLPIADAAGVRYLATEALIASLMPTMNATRVLPPIETEYLSQPEMRDLIEVALEVGWELHPYEVLPIPRELRAATPRRQT